jgi:serine protease inhibitor
MLARRIYLIEEAASRPKWFSWREFVAATAELIYRYPFASSRPFFCAIEDRRGGALLFVGAIYDPVA